LSEKKEYVLPVGITIAKGGVGFVQKA
jgi:hypothetical protein